MTTHEFYRDQEPSTPTEMLKAGVDDLFARFPDNIKRGGVVREFEERLILDTSEELDVTPAATRFWLGRPIPGYEKEAVERWQSFNGPRVEIFESPGQGSIQTDFWIKDGRVLKRQLIAYPGDHNLLPGETFEDGVLRRARESLADALALHALDAATQEQEVNHRNYGEEAEPEALDALLKWIKTGRPAAL